jgi:L-lactate dehydrogenase
MPLEGLCQELGLPYDPSALKAIACETRTAGLEIVKAKGATYYGIAAALARIASAILRDENAVLTVSSLVPESMGLGEVTLSLPAIVNRDGIARVLPVPLDEAERQALRASAETLKQHIASLEIPNVRAA